MNKKDRCQLMEEVWRLEADTLSTIKTRVDMDKILKLEDILYQCRKRGNNIFVTGAGSSSIQSRKIVHNFSCVELPSFFLSTEVAAHGGLGVVGKHDIVIILSRGGQSQEIISLIPFIKAREAILVAVTENQKSVLSKEADFVLNIKIDKEADPLNLLATVSNMVILAVFDALTVLLMTHLGNTKEQFLMIHPGGAVGKKLREKLSST